MKTIGSIIFLLYGNLLLAQTTLAGLSCEHLATPLGIDVPQPRLSWKIVSSRNGVTQRSYQINVGTDSIAVAKMQGKEWLIDKNGREQQLTYSGKSLKPFTKYYWSVTVRDNFGSKTSATSHFETGMINSQNWRGAWISDTRNINLKPAALFRKAFAVQKTIASARAYIAVAGLYELYINGQRVGDQLLNPTYTRYDRRNLYVTHDITNLLASGDNVIGVMLGNGWYNHQSTAVWDFDKAPWRNRPSFCMDVRITFSDGSTQIITSGND